MDSPRLQRARRARANKLTQPQLDLPTFRVVATLVAALSSGVLPLFLVGAFQGRIAEDIETGFAGIGAVLALFFITTGVCSLPAGRLVDRVGAAVALRIGMSFTMLSSVFIALFATSLPRIGIGLILCGLGTTFIDTSGSRALSRAVPRKQQGLGFGAKEASGPLAALLAGVALPILGEVFAWRSLFLFATVFAFFTAMSVPSGLDRIRTLDPTLPYEPQSDDGPIPDELMVVEESDVAQTDGNTKKQLVMLAIASATGSTVAASGASFLVPSMQQVGLTAQYAGLVLALASLVAVMSRVGSGILVDRSDNRELQIVTVLLGSGAFAALGLTLSTNVLADSRLGITVGIISALVLLGGGWGWTGLLFLSGVRISPARPALSGGVVLAGLGLGGAIGPALFGYVAETFSVAASWGGAVPMLAIAAYMTHALHQERALT
ncbi:MAG: MFS transporter [Nitriliruptoraceae bacterium]